MINRAARLPGLGRMVEPVAGFDQVSALNPGSELARETAVDLAAPMPVSMIRMEVVTDAFDCTVQ